MKFRKRKVADKPIQIEPEKKEHPRLRKITVWVVSVFLLLIIGIMVFASIFPTNNLFQTPGEVVSNSATSVQNVFSGITNVVVGYLRTLKYRSNLEYEFNRVSAENVQLSYDSMLVYELQTKLQKYEDIYDEISANAAMSPIPCTVIGREDNNYFSVFTIDKGSNDGIEDYMAVTMSGALVGFTYSVTANSSLVRSIIDSSASIPGLIESSRDQGTIRGTLGVNGEPMCRMYYLQDSLPRPDDLVVTSGVGSAGAANLAFPKGIPIGHVRESTRGMDANKPYIVVEPIVDFQHIEYVIVLRYRPDAAAIETRGNTSVVREFIPLDTPRPLPVLEIGDKIIQFGTPSPTPDPNATPTPVPTATPTPRPVLTLPPPSNSLEYQVPGSLNQPTTVPPSTLPPTPSPTPTFSLDQFTVEED